MFITQYDSSNDSVEFIGSAAKDYPLTTAVCLEIFFLLAEVFFSLWKITRWEP